MITSSTNTIDKKIQDWFTLINNYCIRIKTVQINKYIINRIEYSYQAFKSINIDILDLLQNNNKNNKNNYYLGTFKGHTKYIREMIQLKGKDTFQVLMMKIWVNGIFHNFNSKIKCCYCNSSVE